MKNIHILPTDKPSRLVRFFSNKYHLCKEVLPIQDEERYQHIYITSYEEVKDRNCWVINGVEIFKPSDLPEYSLEYSNRYWEKIILTTDQDLIKDGVQAINDEFLEWFVKNPSCEFIEIYYQTTGLKDGIWQYDYKIIIPKEEPKQNSCDIIFEIAALLDNEQETLLQIANRKLMSNDWLNGAEFGAKWQAEKMYSEEAMYKLMDDYQDYLFKTNVPVKTFKEWFEQFKK